MPPSSGRCISDLSPGTFWGRTAFILTRSYLTLSIPLSQDGTMEFSRGYVYASIFHYWRGMPEARKLYNERRFDSFVVLEAKSRDQAWDEALIADGTAQERARDRVTRLEDRDRRRRQTLADNTTFLVTNTWITSRWPRLSLWHPPSLLWLWWTNLGLHTLSSPAH